MSHALDGIVVLDLGQVYAGPYCTLLLRQLGATVLKVEPPEGEPVRWRPGGTGVNSAFLLLNAGKLGVELDLKTDEGLAVFRGLVAEADVVVENFGPGVMDRLGLSYGELAALNRRIVVASVKGYPTTGAYRDLLGMDVTVQAMSGVASSTGFADGPPVKTGPAVVDFAAGTHLAAGVLAALFQRERTGLGQHVEVAMQDAIIPALASNIAGLLDAAGGAFPERSGNRHGGLAVCPYNIYPAADGWIAVLCIRDRHWRQLCALLDRPELTADPELADGAGRVARMDDVDAAVTAWTTAMPKAELFALLQASGVPAAPVRTLADVVADPEIIVGGILRTVGEGERRGTAFGSPLRLSASARVELTPAPLPGEHTAQVTTDSQVSGAGTSPPAR